MFLKEQGLSYSKEQPCFQRRKSSFSFEDMIIPWEKKFKLLNEAI
jgi:hypothetical protein